MKKTKTPDKSPYVFQEEKFKGKIQFRNKINWTERQKDFLTIAQNKDTRVIFLKGPAGSTKSILSVYASLLLLDEKKVSEVIYIRSAVESSDSKMGFLPGSNEEKMAFYNLPFMDKLNELITPADLAALKKGNHVSCFSTNFARGMSWNAKALIMDECLVGDTYIVTDKGQKTIRSLEESYRLKGEIPLIKTFNEKDYCFEFKKAIKIWSNGIKPTIKIKFGNRKVSCTKNHKFLTADGWKEAENLMKGDIIISNNPNSHQVLNALNDDQEQIFLGSFLGDGSISNHGINRNRLKIIHGIKQSEYCQWKANMFGREAKTIEKNGYSQKPAVSFATKCFAFNKYDFSNKKDNCPQWILDKLDLRGMAIWYMDDGSLNKTKNALKIYTCSFNEDSQKRFVEKFKSIGVNCRYALEEYPKRGKQYYCLIFDAENARKFLTLIHAYRHENLNYKFIENKNNIYQWNNKYKNFNHIICDGIEDGIQQEVFDIEVEDNHNFIISNRFSKNGVGMVVHNCQNSTRKEIITILTRLGHFSRLFILADPLQTDLTNGKVGGFEEVCSVFNNEESRSKGIYVIEFTEEDIMRCELLRYIIKKLGEIPVKH